MKLGTSLFALSLLVAASANAAQIEVNVSSSENAEGAFPAFELVKKGSQAEKVNYELIAGSESVAKTLETCIDFSTLKAQGSVLSRSVDIDYENHREGEMTIRFFVRSAECKTRKMN